MSYGRSTDFFHLPYMESGDILSASEEERRARIIDGLLYVSTYGATNAIITDADYSLIKISDSNYSLKLSSTNTVSILPAMYATFIAVINGYLAYRSGEITVSNLTQGDTWKIFAVCSDSMLSDPTQVMVMATTENFSGNSYLLLATVDFTGESPVLDYSSGKRFYANLSQHSLTSTNPHGNDLTQSNLDVTGNMKISSYKIYPYVIMDVSLDGEQDVEVLASSTGIVPQFVTIMGDPSGIGVEIDDLKVTFSSNSAKDIRVKIEGDPA